MPMASDVIIETFDPFVAPDSDLRARHAFECAMEAELDPETPSHNFDVWLLGQRLEVSFQKHHRWAAWDAARSEVVGAGYLGLEYLDTNRHLAWFDIQVSPAYRRQGLGRRLLAELLPVAEADERTVLGAGTIQGHAAGEAFVTAIGLEEKMVERRSRLKVREVDQAMLDNWVTDGVAKSADYSMHLFEDRIPDEYLDRFVVVLHTMNDAPRDNLDMDDEIITPEQIREREAVRAARGDGLWTLIVRHDPSGELVGFTTIAWHPSIAELAWQYGTAVRPEHRGHGIGRWLKAAMLLKVRAEMPKVTFIDTWNAGTNKWMLAINIDLGFFPYLHYADWQAPLDTLKKAAGL